MISECRPVFVRLLAALVCGLGTACNLFAQGGEPDPKKDLPPVLESHLEVMPYDPAAAISAPQENGSWPWAYVFEDPTRFEWLGFDRDGNPVPKDSLTIYEGMTLWMRHDGRFRIRFRAESPLTQVTIRMQLSIFQEGGAPGTITLPPIRISPTLTEDLNTTSQSFLVTYTGRSAVLKRLARKIVEHARGQEVWEANLWKEVQERWTAATDRRNQAAGEIQAIEAVLSRLESEIKVPKGTSEKCDTDAPPDKKKEGSPSGDLERTCMQLAERLAKAKGALVAAESALKIVTSEYTAATERLTKIRDAAKAIADASNDPAEPWSLNEQPGIEIRRGGTARFGGVPR